MKGICKMCSKPGVLYQDPVYNIAACAKCLDQFSSDSSGLLSSVAASISAVSPLSTSTVTVYTCVERDNIDNAASDKDILSVDQYQEQVELEQEKTPQLLKDSCNGDNVEYDDIENEVNLLYNEEGSCPQCNKTFSRKSSLIAHIRNHSAEKRYACLYCPKKFIQVSNLKRHERIHTNERPFACEDCGKTFRQSTNLNNHRRLHTGERPFVCMEPGCGRSFIQVTSLNNHMKVHYSIQQYSCNYCSKKFTQVSSLNNHLHKHVAFYCPLSPKKTFKQQSDFYRHLKSHGTAFPFQCTKCYEKFTNQCHLDRHLKFHDELKFKCFLCPASFIWKRLLDKHEEEVHSMATGTKTVIDKCEVTFSVDEDLSNNYKYTEQLSVQHSPNLIIELDDTPKCETVTNAGEVLLWPNSPYSPQSENSLN